jgi:hypothetical protein
VALAQENGFRGYEVDRDGKPIAGSRKANEYELLDLMMRAGEPSRTTIREGGYAGQNPPFRLGIEAGTERNFVELWERSFHEAVRTLEQSEYEYDGVVISLPVQIERGGNEKQLDSLLRPLRKKYWIDPREGKAPWIIFDLTLYETLFSQIVPEMLEGIPADDSPFPTPFSLAARRDIQEMAVRAFCQRWLGDNELTHLANAERQRCSNSHRRRVMVQVSSSWGFLAGDSGSGLRQPANCRHAAETAETVQCPRFPKLTEAEKSTLTTLKLGAHASPALDGKDTRRTVEQAAERYASIWKPIGIVEPIPSVVWKKPAPNMFWAPEVMANLQPRR